MGYLVYFNLVRAQKIVNNPHNERQNNFAQQVVRGNITDKDGVVLAETQTDEAEMNQSVSIWRCVCTCYRHDSVLKKPDWNQ